MSPHANSPFALGLACRSGCCTSVKLGAPAHAWLREISNERVGYLHFHGFFAFVYFRLEIFDFNFIAPQDHKAVANRSDAVFRAWLARILLPLDTDHGELGRNPHA